MVGLRDGLVALGYREHEDFVIGVRFTQGDRSALPAAARWLLDQGADIIVTSGATIHAAIETASNVPVVFLGGDPIRQGLIASYARPGGRITGVASLEIELAPKRLEVLRELVPGLKQVLYLHGVNDALGALELAAYRDAAGRLGLTIADRAARSRDEVVAALGRLRRGEVSSREASPATARTCTGPGAWRRVSSIGSPVARGPATSPWRPTAGSSSRST
jgi:putative ABC transport system substrate-binding protein